MTWTVFAVAFGVLALATGLPQVPSARWIFRAWDFPRLQVAFLCWPLDQCLVRPGLAVAGWRREPLPGSDHFALVVDLARCDRDPDPGAQAGHEPAGRVREHLVEALSERQEGAAG